VIIVRCRRLSPASPVSRSRCAPAMRIVASTRTATPMDIGPSCARSSAPSSSRSPWPTLSRSCGVTATPIVTRRSCAPATKSCRRSGRTWNGSACRSSSWEVCSSGVRSRISWLSSRSWSIGAPWAWCALPAGETSPPPLPMWSRSSTICGRPSTRRRAGCGMARRSP
ncbi:hypothetical protein KXW38_001843, partial [Aspergillus fumigatus]